MIAVIATGGKQFKVEVGQTLRIEKVEAEVGGEISLDKVLLTTAEGQESRIGAPTVEGAVVKAKVLSHGKGKKVLSQKFRRRKQFRRIHGHRQPYTEIEITDIQV